MAQLPGQRYLIQQMDGEVVLYHRDTEREVVKFDPSDPNITAQSQLVIYEDDQLTDEEKCFAHFWSGYFHACAVVSRQYP